jgi:S1-C subfamily serine protease
LKLTSAATGERLNAAGIIHLKARDQLIAGFLPFVGARGVIFHLAEVTFTHGGSNPAGKMNREPLAGPGRSVLPVGTCDASADRSYSCERYFSGDHAMRRTLLFLFLGSCSFLGGLVAVALVGRNQATAQAEPGKPAQGSSGSNEISRLGDRFELVASKVSPAVVAIEAIKPPAKGSTKTNPVDESGSGVLFRIASQRGVFVLTNNHVIQRSAPNQITINLADNRIVKPAQVWTDPESDVALLRLDNLDNVPTAILGDSDNVRVGQWVLAIGSPFGLNQTVTHGIISARERGQVSLGNTIRIKDFLQTDAAINPGSSGGPLVNLDGEVIGINTAIASPSGSNSGVAFSIPINMVKRIVRQLLEKGSVTRGYLGVQVASAFEPADAEKLGLGRAQGAWVEKVYTNTPAAAAGLKPNDVVLEVDQVVIRNENHFINLISSLPIGQRIRLNVWRDKQRTTIEAQVGDWAQGQTLFKAP